jgi:hypothetical protein
MSFSDHSERPSRVPDPAHWIGRLVASPRIHRAFQPHQSDATHRHLSGLIGPSITPARHLFELRPSSDVSHRRRLLIDIIISRRDPTRG